MQQPVAVYFLMEEQAKAYREEEEDLFVYILLNVNQLLINWLLRIFFINKYREKCVNLFQAFNTVANETESFT